jgi:hypothetical protein
VLALVTLRLARILIMRLINDGQIDGQIGNIGFIGAITTPAAHKASSPPAGIDKDVSKY